MRILRGKNQSEGIKVQTYSCLYHEQIKINQDKNNQLLKQLNIKEIKSSSIYWNKAYIIPRQVMAGWGIIHEIFNVKSMIISQFELTTETHSSADFEIFQCPLKSYIYGD